MTPWTGAPSIATYNDRMARPRHVAIALHRDGSGSISIYYTAAGGRITTRGDVMLLPDDWRAIRALLAEPAPEPAP